MVTNENLHAAIELLGVSAPNHLTKVELVSLLQDHVKGLMAVSKEKEVQEIDRRIKETENSQLIKLSEAMMHDWFKIKPVTKDLAYELANDIYQNIDKVAKTSIEKKLYSQMMTYFDVVTYIFRYTHYDECSNGFFFRRS